MTLDLFAGVNPAKKYIPPEPQCGVCGLYKTCRSPKMAVDGGGKRGILIVGEAPGAEEDARGHPFVGKSGRFLQEELRRAGIDMRRDCWITNALVCRPPGNKLSDHPRSVEYCRPNMIKAIKELKPQVVLLFGASAVESVIGWLWKESPGGIGRWIGWQIPSQEINAWVCPNWHPAYLFREENPANVELRKLLFRKYLEKAVKLEDRPWKEVLRYEDRIRIIFNPKEAVDEIRKITSDKGPFAFDYETDRLKPDAEEAEIVCCSISDGDVSVAFPWTPATREEMGKFLRSDKGKIASNLQFEERWTRKEFGHGVKNWVGDTMLAAHVLDGRPEITSIKLLSFVLLGQGDYSEYIEPYFQSKGPNLENKVGEVPLGQLLHYCGVDSLLEWLVWRKQDSILRGTDRT